MPRKVTATLPDGRQVTYNNVPYSVTPAAMTARIQKDYGVAARSIDGGGAPKPGSADAWEQHWAQLPPAQAKMLVQRSLAAGVNPSDPRAVALMRIGGVTPPAPQTRQQQIQQRAKKFVDDEVKGPGGSDLSNLVATSAGIRGAASVVADPLVAGARTLFGGGSYADNLAYTKAEREEEASRSTGGEVAGNILANVAMAGGAGAGLKAIGARAAASAEPAIARAGNVLQTILTPAKPAVGTGLSLAAKAGNAARIIGSGAAGGGASSALSGGDVSTGAGVGAVTAGVLGGGGKLLSVLAQPAKAVLGLSSADNILSRLVGTSKKVVQDAYDAKMQDTGGNPTLFEVLPLADRNRLLKNVVVGKDNVVEQSADAIAARGKALGPEMQGTVQKIVQPGRDAIQDTMRADLAKAHGIDPADLTDDHKASVASAMTSPTDMLKFGKDEINAYMAPHNDTRIVNNLGELYSTAPGSGGGSGKLVDLDPEMNAMIRNAGGNIARRADNAGVTAGDVSGIMEKMRDVLGSPSASFADQSAAERGLAHVQGIVDANAPAAGEAMANGTAAYAARMRMAEGMDAAMGGNLRNDVRVGTSQKLARLVGNAYDSTEGDNGRFLGQSNSLLSDLGGSPAEALSSTLDIARNSTGRQLTQNLGKDAAATIQDAARAQDDSAQALASASSKMNGSVSQSSPQQLASALIGLHPGGFMATKAHALAKLSTMTVVPENQAKTIADMLFSRDPALTQRAIDALGKLPGGQDVLKDVATVAGAVAGGQAGAPAKTEAPLDLSTLPDATPAVDTAPEPPNSAAPEPDAAPESTTPDPNDPVASSPYLANLKNLYSTENPDALDFYDRLAQKETSGQHFDASGRAKISPVGAIGLMQVMPGTAPQAAKEAGLPLDMNALYHDPVYNRLVGSAHAGKLLAHYDGDTAKTAAAYNAEQGAVDKAVKAHGDDWLSHLPAETQDYVGAVS